MGTPNRLIHEKSPYLLQHAHNPVDWYPWCDEAFAVAETENKPIFLSIGYATCHWCHVMEKETFQDKSAADELNRTFVCIKVDREERPDVDALYMTACQIFAGRGGWPLTIFMTKDKMPFFAATYLPKNSRYGRAGVIDLCQKVRSLWSENHDAIHASARQMVDNLEKAFDFSAENETLDQSVLETAAHQIQGSFDPKYGGFDRAPKFPTAHRLQFLLHQYHHTDRPELLDMVTHTLTAMRHGGIWDHVGFGFHRYSTDERWLLPHFEKMLYDQALLAMVYLETFQMTKIPLFAQTARDIFTYVKRDMTASTGGFYSAEDADSEGIEGKFYLWTIEQWQNVLGERDAETWQKVLNIIPSGNFNSEATGNATGANIVHLTQPADYWSVKWNISADEFYQKFEDIRKMLFRAREKRIHPLKDDKILTDWNGLMIAAFAMGARILGESEYGTIAVNAAEFIWNHLRTKDGSFLHRYRDGQAAISANANDYAFFIMGLLELYRTTFEVIYLERAISLQKQMHAAFWNKTRGGFFLTSTGNMDIPIRPVELYDGALPSVNSVAMCNLIRLSRLTGQTKWEDSAHQMSQVFGARIKSHPAAHTHFLMGVGYALGRSQEVVLVGNPHQKETQILLDSLNRKYTPGLGVVLKTEQNQHILSNLAQYTTPLKQKSQQPTAYICSGLNCSQPVTGLTDMLALLKKR
jgi:uncharacterized protein YyaL (SSP411 family)